MISLVFIWFKFSKCSWLILNEHSHIIRFIFFIIHVVLSTYVYIDFMHIPYKQEKKWDIWFKLSQLLDFISLTVDFFMMIAVWKTIELCVYKIWLICERELFFTTLVIWRVECLQMSERDMPISLIICDLLKDVRLICQPWWVMGLP